MRLQTTICFLQHDLLFSLSVQSQSMSDLVHNDKTLSLLIVLNHIEDSSERLGRLLIYIQNLLGQVGCVVARD